MPPFEAVIARLARLPSAAAAELARADQRDRWAAEDRVLAERYLRALPLVAANPDDALVLVYGEVLLRGEHGQAVDSDTVVARFPEYRDALDRVFEVHRALAADAHPPPTIAGYDLLRVAGRGGMGAVFQARSVATGQIVAVKVARAATTAGSEELVRFLQEADILARLSHPNVVRFLAAGVCDTGPYLVTEWMPGGSLDCRLDGPFEFEKARVLVIGVARGLAAAHAAGVIHRDVKPGNILLGGTDSTVPKLTDFGLARLAGCGGTLTATGDMLGTRRYMPPEQLDGRTRDIGPWSDLFSLGAVLYELLAGRPAFPDRDTPAGLVGFTVPTPPRAFAPDIPEECERACLTALAYNPAERFRSAADFLAALGPP